MSPGVCHQARRLGVLSPPDCHRPNQLQRERRSVEVKKSQRNRKKKRKWEPSMVVVPPMKTTKTSHGAEKEVMLMMIA